MKKNALRGVVAALLVATPLAASAVVSVPNIQITEWMYKGNGPEYIEFTNLGDSSVDFTGWSYDDDGNVAGKVDLSAFGIVQVGQSVILTESLAADFISVWSLNGVSVIGSNGDNIGKDDQINIYDASGILVDSLTYKASVIKTEYLSGNPTSLAALSSFEANSDWTLASVGDAYGSYASTFGDVGNPGVFALAVPEPSRVAMLLAGLGLLGGIARRRSVGG